MGHARGRAFMLRDRRRAFPISDAALHTHGKAVLPDFRFCEFGANRRFDQFVVLRGESLRWGFGRRSFGFRRGGGRRKRVQENQQSQNCRSHTD